MGNNNSHAINDIRHNEKNLCCLYMAIRKTGPVAIAFAEIYILLNQLGTGQTVREYCKDVLGYNSQKYRDVFSTEERDVLSGSWDPKLQDVTFLYKLLFHVCDLSPNRQNWIDPTYELEFNLHLAKNLRNDTMHGRIELTDAELQTILQDLEQSVCDAIRLAGEKMDRNVSKQDSAFKSKLQTFRPRTTHNFLKVFTNSIRIAAGSVGITTGRFASADGSTGTASASGVPMAAAASDFGSFGAACVGANNFVDHNLESDSIEFGDYTFEGNEEIGRDELMEFLKETEELEFHGVSAIIRRQLDLLNN